MKTPALLTFLLIFVTFSNAYAQQGLKFGPATTYKQKQIIEFVTAQAPESNQKYALAAVDLNDDAIDEYIVRPESAQLCPKKPLCPYQIIAFQDHKPISIGAFDAHKILILDKKTYGIRHIIVYNQSHNDYAHETAIWDPFTFRYQ